MNSIKRLIKRLATIYKPRALMALWGLLGQKYKTKKLFLIEHGYPLNLENPQTFMEKIQWIKFFGQPERFAPYVDKYTVRDYIKEKIGEKYLIPLIGVYTRTEDIDPERLPESFIIKATHGSGWTIIVENKDGHEWNATKKTLDRWLKLNFYRFNYEKNYKPLKGRIVIEKYIRDPDGDLRDYKFHCFNGEPRILQVDSLRFTNHCRDFYDMEFNRLPMIIHYKNVPQPAARPARFEEMIEISRVLSADFPFVRVDLYCTGDTIYFGELTFTPHSGMEHVTPVEYDYLIGSYLNIHDYKH